MCGSLSQHIQLLHDRRLLLEICLNLIFDSEIERGSGLSAPRQTKSLALQVAVVYLPFLQRAFGTTALGASDWLLCLSVASSVLWLREASKALRR